MKNIKFYPTIWQTIPFSFDMVDVWNKSENKRNFKESRSLISRFTKVVKVSWS